VIFIDTGAFYARSVEADAFHRRAQAAWPRLAKERIFTSSLVICETAELLMRRTTPAFAARTARKILPTPPLTILRPSAADELAGLDLMTKYADQMIGFADCVSFLLMGQNHIRRAFSFDRHFETAGYTLWPEP
jgi:uncharacterized protein